MKKILISILICIIFISSNFLLNSVYAATNFDGIVTEGDSFIDAGKKAQDSEGKHIQTVDGSKLEKTVNNVYNILFIIGIAASVIVSAIIGIKIMMGSVEEKAEVKEKLTPYFIGIVVIFASFTIWKVAMQVAKLLG